MAQLLESSLRVKKKDILYYWGGVTLLMVNYKLNDVKGHFNYKNTELKFSWLRLTLSISGVIGVGVPEPKFSLYNTCETRKCYQKQNKTKKKALSSKHFKKL